MQPRVQIVSNLKRSGVKTIEGTRFNFSAEFIIWAAKSSSSKYYLNFDLMTKLNGGKQMSDVWSDFIGLN